MNLNQKQDWIKISYNQKVREIEGTLNSLEFIDNNSYIIFIPTLNLSSYGNNQEEAIYMMREIVIKDFCETIMAQPVEKVISDLKELGWNQSPFFKKELSRTSYISKKGILKELNLDANTEVKESIITV